VSNGLLCEKIRIDDTDKDGDNFQNSILIVSKEQKEKGKRICLPDLNEERINLEELPATAQGRFCRRNQFNLTIRMNAAGAHA